MTLAPRPYQIVGRDFLAGRRCALLADEMRVGKTPQAILAAKELLAERTLIVCPAIAAPHWGSEWWRWWPQAGTFPTIVSYDRLRINAAGILDQQYDVAIVDECHFAKNPAAKRTKLIYGKGGVAWQAKHVWALSGTPAPKHAGELWPMLRAFGVVAMTYEEYLRHFCVLEPLTLRVLGTKERNIPELRELLAKVMLRRTRKEVAPDMPAISFDFLEVEPLGADLNAPNLTGDALLDWLEAHPLADREDRQAVALAKVPPLVDEIVESIEADLYRQTVVFGWHIEPLREVVAQLRSRGLFADVINGETSPAHRQRIQQEFLAGHLQVVVANIAAAGTAIDLSAASHGYFLELDWVPGNNVQAANRLVSLQKNEPVTFDVLTWAGSTDDRVQRVLLRRARELGKLY